MTRAGVFVPEVRERRSSPVPRTIDSTLAFGSSLHDGRAGVAIVPTVEPENLLSWVVTLCTLCTLCTLARLEPEPTGFLGILCDDGFEKYGPVDMSPPRTRAGTGMLSGDGLIVQFSSFWKSGSGDSRPQPSLPYIESWRGRKLRRLVLSVTMNSTLSKPSKWRKLVGALILGRACDCFGRARVARLARDDALAAYSRPFVTHSDICWLMI